MQQLAEAFLDEELGKMVNPAVAGLVVRYSETYLFSSSPSFLVEPIAHRLNITHAYSTEYGVDSNGRFEGIERVVTGEVKAQQLEGVKDGREVVAYSDSILDAPMLFGASKVVCVNPDRGLQRLAQRYGWEILI